MQMIDGRLVLTKELWKQVQEINREGNRVKWTSDLDLWGVLERWDFPKASGKTLREDCDGITLHKMDLMLRAGFPKECLAFVICKTETGEGHAVLCVRTDKGDFICDNRFPDVMGHDALVRHGYRFIHITKMDGDLNDLWEKIIQ